MGKWSAFTISLLPAIPAAYLCFLLITSGMKYTEKMGGLFWVPLGTGILSCVVCVLMPVGIAIFLKSAPKAPKPEKSTSSDSEDDFASADIDEDDDRTMSAYDEDLSDSDFDSAENDDFDFDDASSEFETADFASDDNFSDELDEFDFDDEDDR